METAICAVVCVLTIGACSWLVIREVRAARAAIFNQLQVHAYDLSRICADTSGTADEVVRITDVLTQASQIKRQKSSVFDGDKIQEKPAQRYVPIARRRAQAESASMGPQNHADSVREANARAIESAG